VRIDLSSNELGQGFAPPLVPNNSPQLLQPIASGLPEEFFLLLAKSGIGERMGKVGRWFVERRPHEVVVGDLSKLILYEDR
jgi:hypothetical protein